MTVRAQLIGGPRDGERYTFEDDRPTWCFPHEARSPAAWIPTRAIDPMSGPRVCRYTKRGFHDINEQGERLYRYEG